MPRPIRERDLVLERIKVATDAATRALSTLFAVGAVVVVVVVGGVARVTVRATATATGTATAVITIATVIAIGRATATRTIIIAIIAIEVTVIGATATRTVVVIILEVIGATATRTVVTIVEVTVIALGATATAATAVIAIATARAGVVLLILETRNGQGDLAAIIDTLNDHLNGVAFLEHVFDSVNTLAVGQVADLGDVQQAVGAGGEVHESAERRGLDDLAVVGFAGLGHGLAIWSMMALAFSAASPPSEEMKTVPSSSMAISAPVSS